LVRGHRCRPVGLLAGEQAFLVEVLGYSMGFLEFGDAVQGAFVHEFQVGAGKALGVARGAGLDPGVKPRFGPFAVDVLGYARYRRIVGPAYLARDVVAVFAFIFEVAARAGRGSLATLGVRILERYVPVPFVAHHGDDLAMLAHGVSFPVVVVHAAVAGGTRFGLARFGCGEFVPGVAGVAFVLVGMAHAAAFGDFALRHGGKDGNFYVGFPVQGVRGTSLRPLLVRPDHGVALGFALGKFLQVAGAADVGRGHAKLGHVVGFLLGVDVDVTVNASNFLELFVRTQPVHGTQVLLYVFQFGFLVEDGVVRLQVADLVQVGMRAFLPGVDPHRRFVSVAFDAFLPARHFFHGGRRLVEGRRVHVHAVRYRFPVFGQCPSARSLRRVLVALGDRFVQFLRRGRLLKI